MQDQVYIADSGELEIQPMTWDGQPMYSPATVREGLFDSSAFEQMPGQLAMEGHCEDCGAVISAHPEVPQRCTYCATTRFGAQS